VVLGWLAEPLEQQRAECLEEGMELGHWKLLRASPDWFGVAECLVEDECLRARLDGLVSQRITERLRVNFLPAVGGGATLPCLVLLNSKERLSRVGSLARIASRNSP
jgi:hypothetical protein